MFLGSRKSSPKPFLLPRVLNSLLHSSGSGPLAAIPELWTHPLQFCIKGYWENQVMPLQGQSAIFESVEISYTDTNRVSQELSLN